MVAGPQSQLNLLFDDPKPPRINLITDADAALVRRAAERVAAFLDVPLLGAKPLISSMQSRNPLELLNRLPLPPGTASIRGPAGVVLKGDDVLVLGPRLRRIWLRVLPALPTIGCELYILWLAWFGPAAGRADLGLWAIMVLFGGVTSQIAAFKPLFLYRDHFDRRTGLLTLGWFRVKGTYPLEKMVAVQIIPAGLVVKAGGLFQRSGERVSYQMNLVLADADQDRLHLTDDINLEWTPGRAATRGLPQCAADRPNRRHRLIDPPWSATDFLLSYPQRRFRVLTGPNVILALKTAVAAVTLILAASLTCAALGKYRLHGRLNVVFFILTLTAVLGLEAIIRFVKPGLFDYFDPDTRRMMTIHLCFSIPSTILMPLMLLTGLSHRRKIHVSIGTLFLTCWIGTFITGIFFL